MGKSRQLKLLGDQLVAVDENQTARVERHRPSPRGANYIPAKYGWFTEQLHTKSDAASTRFIILNPLRPKLLRSLVGLISS